MGSSSDSKKSASSGSSSSSKSKGSKNIQYFTILGDSFNFMLKYKVLLFFAFLIMMFTGSGSGNINFPSTSDFDTGEPVYERPWTPTETSEGMAPDILQDFRSEYGDFLEGPMVLVIGLAILGFLLVWMVISFYVRNMSWAGLIRGVKQGLLGKGESMTIKSLWSGSTRYLGRLIGLELLAGLVIFLIIMPAIVLIVLIAFAGGAFVMLLCCLLIPVFFLLILFSWVIGFVIQTAKRFIIFDDVGVIDSIKKSWEFTKKYFWKIFLGNLVLIIPAIPFMMVGYIVMLMIMLPLMIALVPMMLSSSTIILGIVIAIIAGLLLKVVLGAITAPLVVVTESFWQMIMVDLEGKKVLGK